MATDIELVIKIPEEVYKASQIIDVTYDDVIQIPLECIVNGIPLPKGHGDLIDISKIHKAIPAEEDSVTGMGMTYEEMDAYNDGIDAMWNLVQRAETIIEAESEET